jgi:hypothetical protein
MSDMSLGVSGTSGTDKAPAKKRRDSVVRYPHTASVALTKPMADSLLRLCPPSSPDNQSALLRRLLHQVLLAADPLYAREMEKSI